ncbi:hypothetical protein Bbelb_375950 [Branchiostoma belcheri]|nr:hypothetical protein Bbelb_375950 [Branchiostoma belcheri]
MENRNRQKSRQHLADVQPPKLPSGLTSGFPPSAFPTGPAGAVTASKCTERVVRPFGARLGALIGGFSGAGAASEACCKLGGDYGEGWVEVLVEPMMEASGGDWSRIGKFPCAIEAWCDLLEPPVIGALIGGFSGARAASEACWRKFPRALRYRGVVRPFGARLGALIGGFSGAQAVSEACWRLEKHYEISSRPSLCYRGVVRPFGARLGALIGGFSGARAANHVRRSGRRAEPTFRWCRRLVAARLTPAPRAAKLRRLGGLKGGCNKSVSWFVDLKGKRNRKVTLGDPGGALSRLSGGVADLSPPDSPRHREPLNYAASTA